MTIESRELSEYSGLPFWLYDVRVGTYHWYMTTLREPFNYQGNVYAFERISHSQIPSSTDPDNSGVTISLPEDSEVAGLFRFGSPGTDIDVTIYYGHIGETEIATQWFGVFSNYKLTPPMVELTTESRLAAVRRIASTWVISAACPVPLYGPECGVNKEDYLETGHVSAINGLVITVPAFSALPAAYFVGGFVSWLHPDYGVEMTEWVTAHNGASLTLAMPAPSLLAGSSINAYPGCDHAYLSHCHTRFGNSINYRGKPFINNRNPFGGFGVY